MTKTLDLVFFFQAASLTFSFVLFSLASVFHGISLPYLENNADKNTDKRKWHTTDFCFIGNKEKCHKYHTLLMHYSV